MNDSVVGLSAKIKDSAKYTVSGNTISPKMRQDTYYVKYVHPKNGIVTLMDESGRQIATFFPKDIEIGESRRTFIDSECDFDDIDVRIMGVPERMENIRWNQSRLRIPDENIFLDVKKEGCLVNAMRAWSKPTDKQFVMVLQDDIELCDRFTECCNKIVKAHPDDVIALFAYGLLSYQKIGSIVSKIKAPYYECDKCCGASGQGIILRSEWIEDCLSGWLTSGIKGDDTNINAWAKKRGLRIITTIPTILQHLENRSIFSPGMFSRQTDFYEKSKSIEADWDNGYVTPYSNLRR